MLGAGLVTLLVQFLNFLGTQPGMPGYASSVFSYAVYALLLILVLLFLPGGLLPALSRWMQRRVGGRSSPHSEEAAPESASSTPPASAQSS